MNGTLAYIEDRDIEIDDLMQYVKLLIFLLEELFMVMMVCVMLFILVAWRIVMRAKASFEEVQGLEMHYCYRNSLSGE